MNDSWMREGNCHPSRTPLSNEQRDRIFFPDTSGMAGVAAMKVYNEARLYCSTCPVVVRCYDFAQGHELREGFFGNVSPRQRAKALPVWRAGEAS